MKIALFRHREKKLLEQFAQAQRSKTLLFLQNQFSLPTEDCEDIFQEAFIVLYHNIQEGKLDELTSSLNIV
jgi:DNA-directed RNA polymerase specialized sigma24 family protein